MKIGRSDTFCHYRGALVVTFTAAGVNFWKTVYMGVIMVYKYIYNQYFTPLHLGLETGWKHLEKRTETGKSFIPYGFQPNSPLFQQATLITKDFPRFHPFHPLATKATWKPLVVG